jgi:hypothetical protein
VTAPVRSPYIDAEVLPVDAWPAGGPAPALAAARSPFLGGPSSDIARSAGRHEDAERTLGEHVGTDRRAAADAFEHVLAEPKRPPARVEVMQRPHLRVEGAGGAPLTAGDYAFHQGSVSERGSLAQAGLAYLGKIDPARPFRFEVRDRVCLIRAGAFLDPDDLSIEYGGTAFDWTLVRNNQHPEQTFWPHYQRAMDLAEKPESSDTAEGCPLHRLAQHEHITRRPIRIVGALQSLPGRVRIRALPAQLRVGPFVRYADHERAVIWLESVTPCMARVRFRPAGGSQESARHAATVRVGGRHYAAVEIDRLEPGRFYDYTVELAPLPASGAVPVTQAELQAAFPTLTPAVAAAMRVQCAVASLQATAWLTFRTLQPRYDRQLRFATGSCRWYPGDRNQDMTTEQLGPDMLDGLGQWLRGTPKERWPQFAFFGGDQIYADEIGEDHARMMTGARFATRVPGPADPAASAGAKLVDGAWAGRFAHRYRPYIAPPVARVDAIASSLGRLDDIRKRYPDIDGITREYPDLDPSEALKMRHATLRNRRQLNGTKAEDDDERRAREALEQLPTVRRLVTEAEPYRAFLPHWRAATGATGALNATSVTANPGTAPGTAAPRNPFATRYLAHNFLLWSLPTFEDQLPTVSAARLASGVRTPSGRGHPSAERGRHAADFAEYAYLYERAWTSSRNVRLLLAQLPTFLMLDDHEATDDWNFSVAWVRMLHNRKDELRMWPKTLTDALAAYWVYQGWGNKAPSQWLAADPRVQAMTEAQRTGTDALPALRRCIHAACFARPPAQDPKAVYQTGLGLDWHYRLPFEPPFLVPDCRTRKRLVRADDDLRVIAHDGPIAERPQTQTIDDAQLAWMRGILLDARTTGPVAFIAPSTPLMLQKKLMDFMLKPEVAARAWAQGSDVASITAALLSSTRLGTATNRLLTVFRRGKDLEHMMRERSWRDLWGLVDAMRKAASPIKTLVLVSGDVHHSYCMTATLPGPGRPRPELLQITSSGLQTTIRGSTKTDLAEALSSRTFDVGKIRLAPGYMAKNGTGSPDAALFANSVALVDVAIGPEVHVVVTHLSGKDRHVYRYTSGPGYTARGAPGVPGVRAPDVRDLDRSSVK